MAAMSEKTPLKTSYAIANPIAASNGPRARRSIGSPGKGAAWIDGEVIWIV